MSNMPKNIIDMHIHVFNARYLPVKGATRQYIGDALAGALATIMNSITRSFFHETEEDDWAVCEYLQAREAERQPADYAEALWILVENQIRKRARRQKNMFSSMSRAKRERFASRELERDPLLNALEALFTAVGEKYPALAGAVDGRLRGKIVDDIFSVKPGALALLAAKKLFLSTLNAISDTLQKAQAFGDSVHDYLEFFYTMTRDEKSMLTKIRTEYRSDRPMRLFVHYMMDMKYGCEPVDDPYYSFFPQQCENMLQLAAASGGALLGFSAFHPRRSDWREIADKSLRMGFVGFKFYPSMGFLPIGNDDPVVEKNVEDFLLYCIERNVPVVAHCTPCGFQAVKGSGVRADPRHWKKRLETPGFEKLRLNLCHAGGGEQTNMEAQVTSKGWYAGDGEWEGDGNYARTVAELCGKYKNVYCDVSYLLELYEKGGAADSVRERFERNLERELFKNGFAKKIIFGSDWNMPQIIAETDAYLDYYLTLFSKPAFNQYRDDFFWKNALAFLDLEGYLKRLNDIAERPEVLAYAGAVRLKYELLIGS